MVVRIKLELRSGRRKVKSLGLLNAGYEAEEPEITLPEDVARKLGLFPKLPPGARVVDYLTVGGGSVRGYFIPRALEVSALAEGRRVGPVRSNAAVLSGEQEVILSDKLIDSLGIVIERAGEGLWRFRDEKKPRKSAKP